jgi:hypothetical protein
MRECGKNQYSELRHICNEILLGHDPKQTWAIAMNGHSIYLDDSGHPKDKPYLAIGGFIAAEERWIAFEAPWRAILQKRGIEFPFHSADFFTIHRKNPKLKYIVSDLVRVICNHVEAAFSVVIDVNAYDEFNQSRRLDEFAGTPYAVITRSIYDIVGMWQKRVGQRAPLLYFVEDGTLHRGDMMDCLRDRDGISPPIAVPKGHVACQAADLYAYSVFQTAVQKGKYFISLELFHEKLRFPDEHMDARIFRSDLETYLSRPTTVLVGSIEKFAIPDRTQTAGLKVNFKGNTKKIRRSIVRR